MFMFFPTTTDAPIYHWPKATVSLIVLNSVLLFAVPPDIHRPELDDDDAETQVEHAKSPFETYALMLGDGLHPVQWVTHNFLHFGLSHLIGNVVFLWAFGIPAEGKLGMFKFLAAYLAIGTLHGALTQLVFLRYHPPVPAAGASAVIMGLMALCMVWSPRNELHFVGFWWFWIRFGTFQFDLRYTSVAMLFVAQQIFNIFWYQALGVPIVSELGHLSGVFWGTVIGFVMLKAGWVDCEGWDILSVWQKNRKLAKDWKRRGEQLDRQKRAIKKRVKNAADEAVADRPDDTQRAANALKKVQRLIEMGDLDAALSTYDKGARTLPNWPPEADLLGLIKAMHSQQGGSAASIPLMRDFCRHWPDRADRMRLKLAQILIRERQKPTQALRVLGEIRQPLPADLEKARATLTHAANRMLEDGVLEVEGDDY